MSLSERMEAAEPFFRLAREVINPVDGERPWHADSKDWMVVFSFAGHSLTLGDLRRAAGQDSSAGDDGAAMRHTLSVQATDKSDRAEGVAALQQAGKPVAWRPIESAPKDGTCLLVGHEKAVFSAWWSEEDAGWVDGATDLYGDHRTYDPTHWMPLPSSPLPQQTALVEPYSPDLDDVNGRLA